MAISFDAPIVGARAVILVEGASDRIAVQTLAERQGRDLAAEGISVLAMGGATNIGHYLERFGPQGADLALAGLYDEAEGRFFRRALAGAGRGTSSTTLDLPALG